MFTNFVKAIETAIENGTEIAITLETKDPGSICLHFVPDLVEYYDGLIMITHKKSIISIDAYLSNVEYDEEEDEYTIIGDHSVITVSF